MGRLLLMGAPDRKRKNLLTANQSNIETDATGLGGQYCTIARDATKAWQGGASLDVTVTAGSVTYRAGVASGSRVSVTAGKRYTGSARAQADSAKNMQVLFDWYNSSAVRVSAAWSDVTGVGTDKWTPVSFSQIAPVGAVTAIVAFGAEANQGDFDYWLDGLKLEDGHRESKWVNGG